jgi:glycosyltransferase involved in cell wall biosynthesis
MTVLEETLSEFVDAPARALKIALSHPHGNANSYHAARAFNEENWLQRFQAGILKDSATSQLLRWLPTDIKQRALNRNYAGIPEARQNSHLLWETISRLGIRLKPGGLTTRINWYDVLFWGHDYQVSKSLTSDLNAVYAYEDGARRTFAAASKKEIATLYELPLGYYRGVADEINRARRERCDLQPRPYVEANWKQARKDEELRLADVVVVPCAWALDSLRFSKAGNAKSVIKVPYGTPADEIAARTAPPDGQFTILFAGHIGLRKGVPHLIEAWEKLQLKNARLWLAGSFNLPKDYLREHAASFEYLGAIPRVELLQRMQQADLFAFPSLAEGFGLVIGEAMASGVPVLTTANTGGPELIEDGEQGWCVAAHAVEPLIERIEWASQHREALAEMGKRARRRAEQWTWSDYRRELIVRLSPLL